MLFHHLRHSWRNIRRNRSYTLLNVGGLAMGLTVALIVGLWVRDEITYNTSFDNYQHIAQLMVRGHNSSGVYVQWAASPPYAPTLREQFPDFEHIATFSQAWSQILATPSVSVVKSGYYAEEGAADMLALKMVEGTRTPHEPTAILLSQSTAHALFGQQSAVGKSIRMDDKTDVIVGGVYKDIPANTDFADMQFLASWRLYITINRNWLRLDDWRQNGFLVFAQIKKDRDFASVSDKIKDVKLQHSAPEEARNHPQFFLHPMSKWRLYSDLESDVETGRIRLVWMFGAIGAFVLILACINFMNLSTARSEKRAKEVGIRKASGSGRLQLIIQFFSESVLMTALAFAVALVAVLVVLPTFNEVSEKQVEIPFGHLAFWISCFLFILVTGIIAGSYPALYLSSFQPRRVLKGQAPTGSSIFLRRALLVVQFTVSIILIIGVTVVFQQIETGKLRAMGYDPNGLLWINTRANSIHEHIDVIRNELVATGKIAGVAESVDPVTVGHNAVISGFDWTGTGPNNDIAFRCLWSSPQNGKVLKWRIMEGRDFNEIGDSTSMILNEAAVAAMELKYPVGTAIRMTIFDESKMYKVVGVVKNLIMESPYAPVRPTIYMTAKNAGYHIVNIRLTSTSNIPDGIAEVQRIVAKYDPSSPFAFEMADTAYSKKFGEEERVGKLAGIFAGLAVLISILGMLGLASFVAERRSKEIAIRKVLGATVTGIWQMLSKDFVLLALVSSALAIPVAGYFSRDWLQQFEIRTALDWRVFLVPALVTLLITLITISYQTIRAAVANPVESLKRD